MGERRGQCRAAAANCCPIMRRSSIKRAKIGSDAWHGHFRHARAGYVSRAADTGWVSMSAGAIRPMMNWSMRRLLALADLKAVEARTAKADWHRALGLGVPEDLGAAVRFRVSDGAGVEIASLLGKEQQSEAEAKQRCKITGLNCASFMCAAKIATQSWLARGRLPRNPIWRRGLTPSLPRHAAKNCNEGALWQSRR